MDNMFEPVLVLLAQSLETGLKLESLSTPLFEELPCLEEQLLYALYPLHYHPQHLRVSYLDAWLPYLLVVEQRHIHIDLAPY